MSRRIQLDLEEVDVSEKHGTATVRLASWDEPTAIVESLVDGHIVRWRFVYEEPSYGEPVTEDTNERGVRIGFSPRNRRIEFIDLDLNVVSSRLQGVGRIQASLEYTIEHEKQSALGRLSARAALRAIRSHSRELAEAG